MHSCLMKQSSHGLTIPHTHWLYVKWSDSQGRLLLVRSKPVARAAVTEGGRGWICGHYRPWVTGVAEIVEVRERCLGGWTYLSPSSSSPILSSNQYVGEVGEVGEVLDVLHCKATVK